MEPSGYSLLLFQKLKYLSLLFTPYIYIQLQELSAVSTWLLHTLQRRTSTTSGHYWLGK